MFLIKKFIPIAVIVVLVASVAYIIFSGNKEKVMEVPKASNFISLEIQTIENNKEVKKERVTIKDQAKMQKVLDAIDGQNTKQITIGDTEKEMKGVKSYFFYFENKKERDLKKPFPYAFFITEKGAVYYTHKGVDEMSTPQRILKDSPEILKELKDITAIK
ncbi:hypothetical protein KZO01_03070 [Kurthia zopfii]|uniref:Uncharacterized protein n=1 Tax=Kurthia zopfii TaxID=1650 RepID=A0A2U3AF84_9BACL|nr:hypothetical protein [Kurthia zopfii]PWI23175.1 hypothetical protein DF281_03885 [Kurthia zopfii]TDR41356.1 hypothetical protein DFR61_10649 [Kurthia zopfii]STX09861.1 Uncharacterised protein [Kurthia zopfii]VEI07284.1 Uncharacterised protein [Kurthia zopfii]GEK29998.1 hypothetical protein KZO01_03070 [Kurthia zopfii]